MICKTAHVVPVSSDPIGKCNLTQTADAGENAIPPVAYPEPHTHRSKLEEGEWYEYRILDLSILLFLFPYVCPTERPDGAVGTSGTGLGHCESFHHARCGGGR